MLPHDSRPHASFALGLLLALGACACGSTKDPGDRPATEAARPAAGLRHDLHRAALLASDRMVAERRVRQAFMPAEGPLPVRCPDADIALSARSEDARTLVLDSRDVRDRPKDLLPISLLRRLTADERLESLLEAGQAPSRIASALDEAAHGAELARVRKLSEREYKATFYVTHYAPPRLVYKLERNRREWIAPRILARLVIHGLDEGSPLCGVELDVTVETTTAPTQRATKEQTELRLLRELADALRGAAVRELAKQTAVLLMPSRSVSEERRD